MAQLHLVRTILDDDTKFELYGTTAVSSIIARVIKYKLRDGVWVVDVPSVDIKQFVDPMELPMYGSKPHQKPNDLCYVIDYLKTIK